MQIVVAADDGGFDACPRAVVHEVLRLALSRELLDRDGAQPVVGGAAQGGLEGPLLFEVDAGIGDVEVGGVVPHGANGVGRLRGGKGTGFCSDGAVGARESDLAELAFEHVVDLRFGDVGARRVGVDVAICAVLPHGIRLGGNARAQDESGGGIGGVGG